MMDRLDITQEQAIKAILDLWPDEKPPGWITAVEMGEVWGIDKDAARGRLEKLVYEGAVERHEYMVEGRRMICYRAKVLI